MHPTLGLHDLVSKKSSDKSRGHLQLCPNNMGGYYVEGLCKLPVSNAQQLASLLLQVAANRNFVDPAVGIANAIVYLRVTRNHFAFYNHPKDGPKRAILSSTRSSIALVDLVGAVPAALHPTVMRGSVALGPFDSLSKSIEELGSGRQPLESPLSKLLQDFMGGNSKTLLLVHVQVPACTSFVHCSLCHVPAHSLRVLFVVCVGSGYGNGDGYGWAGVLGTRRAHATGAGGGGPNTPTPKHEPPK